MNWITIYIAGKSDFREAVRKKLDHSTLDFMPGYIENSFDEINKHDLYWLEENILLREVKAAIGGKLIWKHRLRFYTSLEEFIKSQQKPVDNSLTEEERHTFEEIQTGAKHEN